MPARAYIKCIKQFNGRYSCDKCEQEGVWNGPIPKIYSRLRTDATFKLKMQFQHHNGVSPIERLPVGMVSQFPIDYMHQVCLGMRRIIKWWIGRDLRVRLNAHSVQAVSHHLQQLKSHIPCEFNQTPINILQYNKWKATEL